MGRAKSVTLPTATMRKRVGLNSSYSDYQFGLKKHKSFVEEDKISKLPDEILVSILSLLTITEAARTSIISHRWERLWISYEGCLNFDIRNRLCNVKERLWRRERTKYITRMNKVLRTLLLFGSSSFSAFTVCFDDWYNYPKSLIDKFVEFAMAKRFQRLEFDMSPAVLGNMCCYSYTFPTEFYDWIKQPCGLYRISALTSLTLKHINVNGEFIEYILSNCPLLERLSVEEAHLLNLKVSGAAALRLKHLEIINCYCMESLEVSAPNLLSLNYIGYDIKLQVENVPKLVEASIGRDVTTYMSCSLASYLSQLQTLLLEFYAKVATQFTQVVVLDKLKHLVLRVKICREVESLLGWISLIDASPFLQKFTLEAITLATLDYRKKIREVCKVTSKHPHQCLKVVELLGFTGVATEVELALHIFENATTLERVIINRCGQYTRGTPFELDPQDVHSKVKEKRALQLKRYLPPRVELVLI